MRNNIGLQHYYQLLSYVHHAKDRGEYYGNKRNFDRRHDQIVVFLLEAIEKLEDKKAINPEKR